MASLRVLIALLCLLLPACTTNTDDFSNTHLIEYHGDRMSPKTPLRGTGMLPKIGTYNPIPL